MDPHQRAITELLEQSIPRHTDEPLHQRSTHVACCCGKNDCAFLAHNRTLIASVERDAQTAAKLGQALIARHEAYVVDAEKERAKMAMTIERLEEEKKALEQKNTVAIQENRTLLDQLEALNTNLADSDIAVQSISQTLQSTQEELTRLTSLASRAEALELQLTRFEREHQEVRDTLVTTEEKERSAVQRWKSSERSLALLQDQIDKIESEAKSEQLRHTEIINRMERQRAVEKQLESAAGRLKSAAAARNGTSDKGNPDVVSHFVKDILQDNANLQMGIVELREMLMSSNEEVERLRQESFSDQLAESEANSLSNTPTLKSELNIEPVRNVSQELHVHHHYYKPTGADKGKASGARRVRSKRNNVARPLYTHTPGSSGSQTPSLYRGGDLSSAATILSHTAVSVPQPSPNITTPRNQRWSTHTNSSSVMSLSSSPQSTHNRSSSICDRVFSDYGNDLDSRPTSPESAVGMTSPISATISEIASQGLPDPPSAKRSFSTPNPFRLGSGKALPTLTTTREESFEAESYLQLASSPPGTPCSDRETSEASLDAGSDTLSPFILPADIEPAPFNPFESRQLPLRRASSHDSLLSISGMDISTHTIRPRPSMLLLNASATARKPSLTTANVTATARTSTGASPGLNSSNILTRNLESRSAKPSPSLGAKVGGWVWGRWGMAPSSPSPATTPVTARIDTDSASGLTASSGTSVTSGDDVESGSSRPEHSRKLSAPKIRSPGINQAGPILGLGPEVKISGVKVAKLDRAALRETLGE